MYLYVTEENYMEIIRKTATYPLNGRVLHYYELSSTRQFELNKRQLKRINWDTVKTTMKVLYDNNKMKKTNLAMHSGLSYNNLVLYLNWLDTIDLIKKEVDEDGFELISLSDKGRDLYVQKLK